MVTIKMTYPLIMAFVLMASLAAPAVADGQDTQYGARRTVFEVGQYRGFILHAPQPAADGAKPWVWYAPTFIGKYPNESNGWLLKRLLERGFSICGVEVGESYGSPAGTAAYDAFYRHVIDTYGLDAKPSLLAQSRGGLMLYNWAARNPRIVRCIVGIYPVCDLLSYPGLAAAAPAYGMTEAELAAALPRYNPIDQLQPLADAAVPILHIHGDADPLVPLETNSRALYRRYMALGGSMRLMVVAEAGHAEIAAFFQEPALLEFIVKGRESE